MATPRLINKINVPSNEILQIINQQFLETGYLLNSIVKL